MGPAASVSRRLSSPASPDAGRRRDPSFASPAKSLIMEQILKDFGIQPILLAAQIVNFLVLLWILKRLLYKPILKILDDRKQRIEKSLKNAEEIELQLQKTKEQSEKIIAKTLEESQKILNDTNRSATQILEDARGGSEQILMKAAEDAKELIKLERVKLEQEVKDHLSEIVTLALKKVTGKLITTKDQKKKVEDTLREIQ